MSGIHSVDNLMFATEGHLAVPKRDKRYVKRYIIDLIILTTRRWGAGKACLELSGMNP